MQFHPKHTLTVNQWKNWLNPITKKGTDFHKALDDRKKELAVENGFNFLVLWEDETFENLKSIIRNKILELYEYTNNQART